MNIVGLGVRVFRPGKYKWLHWHSARPWQAGNHGFLMLVFVLESESLLLLMEVWVGGRLGHGGDGPQTAF
jgi:hypothetical protein